MAGTADIDMYGGPGRGHVTNKSKQRNIKGDPSHISMIRKRTSECEMQLRGRLTEVAAAKQRLYGGVPRVLGVAH